jgi:hypothetical protein
MATLPPCYFVTTKDTYQTTRCHNPEDSNMNLQLRGNLKSNLCNHYGKTRLCGICSLEGLPTIATLPDETVGYVPSLRWYALPSECKVLQHTRLHCEFIVRHIPISESQFSCGIQGYVWIILKYIYLKYSFQQPG